MKFVLTGNYGIFEITKTIDANDRDDAFRQTGIMNDLMNVGWEIVTWPDGEEWEIEEVVERHA